MPPAIVNPLARLQCLDYSLAQHQPQQFARQLLDAAQHQGFALLAHHPITPAMRQRTLAQMHRFFALPLRHKQRISIAHSPNHRGYFAFGEERLNQAYARGDYKEGIKLGRHLEQNHPLVARGVPLHGPNQWPDQQGFRSTMEAFFTICEDIGKQLMRSFAMALDLPPGYFDPVLNQSMATLAPLHYPPDLPDDGVGAGAHTDFGCLTLVQQDGTPGLEVWDARLQQWQRVDPSPQLLVVNVGDMLQRWSNNRLRSTRHRVRHSGERYSLAFFYDPNYDTSIACLPNCTSAACPVAYPPTTALAYLLHRIGDTFDYFAQKV